VNVLTILAAVAAAVLAIPAVVFFVECVASLFLRAGKQVARPEGVSLRVMIPAHDEELGIAATLAEVQSQLAPDDRILLVADNCSDGTAEIALAAGAEVIERVDSEQRGKGYALAYGIDHLASNPPDVLIVIDADCHLIPGTIDALVRNAVETGRPVQADYVLQPTERSPISMISALAFLVRNRVRPRGLRRLKQPCHLDGTGMAFPWRVARSAPDLGGSIVEDLTMGIELALKGHEPVFCIDAGVRSRLPGTESAAMQQRRRWEHGQLATLVQYGPRLICQGISRRRLGLIAMGADLMVPPLAMLTGLLVLVLSAAGVVVVVGGSPVPLWIALVALGLIGLGVGVGWARYGRTEVPLRYLLLVPLYIVWKVPLYFSFLVGRGEKRWRRTDR